MPIINLENVVYKDGDRSLISEITLSIPEKETIIFAGAGESGRSLLLTMIAGILPPTSGRILYDNADIYEVDPETLKKIKRQIGFSFQYEGLLSNLTIEENILLPIKFFDSENLETYLKRINELLDFFSIGDSWQKRPSELSLQKKKILAFIRSIIMNPKVLFVDDPYFSLDQFYQRRFMECLKNLRKTGVTLIIVTNSEDIMVQLADRILFFRNGTVESIMNREQITPTSLRIIETMFMGS